MADHVYMWPMFVYAGATIVMSVSKYQFTKANTAPAVILLVGTVMLSVVMGAWTSMTPICGAIPWLFLFFVCSLKVVVMHNQCSVYMRVYERLKDDRRRRATQFIMYANAVVYLVKFLSAAGDETWVEDGICMIKPAEGFEVLDEATFGVTSAVVNIIFIQFLLTNAQLSDTDRRRQYTVFFHYFVNTCVALWATAANLDSAASDPFAGLCDLYVDAYVFFAVREASRKWAPGKPTNESPVKHAAQYMYHGVVSDHPKTRQDESPPMTSETSQAKKDGAVGSLC